MRDICVCIGSSCHIKGSNSVVECIKKIISEKGLTEQVELRGSFCMGECRDGVCIDIDGKKIRNVTPENVREIIEREL